MDDIYTDPVRRDYEVIRDIMLADETVAARGRETGLDRETVGEKARRFVQRGMFGLVDRRMMSPMSSIVTIVHATL